jgi:acyl-CoA hydrolase
MNGKTGVISNDVKKSVDDVINYVGKDITFAMTLGLGKPILFINELYRRAKEDPTINLKIVTALSLERPKGKSELEKRFIEPLAERVFHGTPEFQYMLDFRTGKMPKNVSIYEFFGKAGLNLKTPHAQQNHLNSSYTHVVRDAMDFGTNVFGQLIGCRKINGKLVYSMGCNTDICIEANELLHKKRANGDKVAVIAEVNEQMPFMYGDAIYDAKNYDILLHGPEFNYPLFGPPKDSVNIKDHAIGLHVSTLIKDGGTIQVGIGALGDAIASGLSMRQNENAEYNRVLEETGIVHKYKDLISEIGGTGTFKEGLYGSSEMFVDAFMQLYKSGVLKRKVYENTPIMKLLNAGKISSTKIPANIIELLLKEDGIHEKLRENEFKMLTYFGILKEDLKFKDGFIIDGKTKYSADFSVAKNLTAIKKLIGKELKNGQVILGAFYLGPRAFYNDLNAMSEEERMQFGMSGVEKVNQLYGDEVLRSLQRKEGRFINTGMMANLMGAITSDYLEDQRVVSGIGGQYNFVAMAHALPDARCIMMLRSTRSVAGKIKSSILYKYGHCSIPKYMRDILVTEYGIADLRGKPDSEVINEMLKVTDSRFQDELIKEAKKYGKLPADFELAPEYKQNFPQKIEALLKSFQVDGHFVSFPFGTDFTAEEIVIGGSLKNLNGKRKTEVLKKLFLELFRSIPPMAEPYIKRMGLDNPANRKEKIMRKIVIAALRANGKI